MRTSPQPQRSCVSCGVKADKRDLVRVVRSPEGECVVDETGKRAGRGAYVCRRPGCWSGALRTPRLSRALRGDIGDGDRERLAAFAESMRAPAAGG